MGRAARRTDVGRCTAQPARAPLQDARRARYYGCLSHRLIRYVCLALPPLRASYHKTENRLAQVISSLGSTRASFTTSLMGGRLAPPMDELFAATAGGDSTCRRHSASLRSFTSCPYRSPLCTKLAGSCFSRLCFMSFWHYADRVPLQGHGDRRI